MDTLLRLLVLTVNSAAILITRAVVIPLALALLRERNLAVHFVSVWAMFPQIVGHCAALPATGPVFASVLTRLVLKLAPLVEASVSKTFSGCSEILASRLAAPQALWMSWRFVPVERLKQSAVVVQVVGAPCNLPVSLNRQRCYRYTCLGIDFYIRLCKMIFDRPGIDCYTRLCLLYNHLCGYNWLHLQNFPAVGGLGVLAAS